MVNQEGFGEIEEIDVKWLAIEWERDIAGVEDMPSHAKFASLGKLVTAFMRGRGIRLGGPNDAGRGMEMVSLLWAVFRYILERPEMFPETSKFQPTDLGSAGQFLNNSPAD
jgi:hypothetical protein